MFLTLTLASNDALIRPYSLKFIPLKGIMRKMYSTKNNSNNNVVKANIIRYRANTCSRMSTLVRRNFHTQPRAPSQSYGLHSHLGKTEEKTCITKVHKTIYSPKNNRKSGASATPSRFISTLCLYSLRKKWKQLTVKICPLWQNCNSINSCIFLFTDGVRFCSPTATRFF